jgi:hypothetical protein
MERTDHAAPASKIGRLRAALLELLTEHERDGALPTSARFLFYELVQRGVVSKEKSGARRPDQDMHVALTDLREGCQVPWDWIVDETRSLDSWHVARTVAQWALDVLPQAKLDPWDGGAPLILTESRSLAGVLRDLAGDYAVPIAATNGQCGGFLRTEIAPTLRPRRRVLYLGDWDRSGNLIEANTRTVLERKAGALRWERLALTENQVGRYSLPKIIKHDRRYKDGGAHEAVETDFSATGSTSCCPNRSLAFWNVRRASAPPSDACCSSAPHERGPPATEARRHRRRSPPQSHRWPILAAAHRNAGITSMASLEPLGPPRDRSPRHRAAAPWRPRQRHPDRDLRPVREIRGRPARHRARAARGRGARIHRVHCPGPGRQCRVPIAAQVPAHLPADRPRRGNPRMAPHRQHGRRGTHRETGKAIAQPRRG